MPEIMRGLRSSRCTGFDRAATAALLPLGLVASFASGAQAQTPLPREAPIGEEQIVVTGRKGAPTAEPDAVEVLRSFCFDPARRTGRPIAPETMSRWFLLEEPARRQFRIDDPATPAYVLADEFRGHELWLKIERIRRSGSLVEDRCTLLVVGGGGHDRFVRDMARLFRGPPTQRHVGHPDGVAALPGWKQWLWTGLPQRRSRSWRSIPARNDAGGQGWIVVIDPAFYDRHDYIYGDLKSRPGAQPLSLLTFAVVRRIAAGDREEASGRRRQPSPAGLERAAEGEKGAAEDADGAAQPHDANDQRTKVPLRIDFHYPLLPRSRHSGWDPLQAF